MTDLLWVKDATLQVALSLTHSQDQCGTEDCSLKRGKKTGFKIKFKLQRFSDRNKEEFKLFGFINQEFVSTFIHINLEKKQYL